MLFNLFLVICILICFLVAGLRTLSTPDLFMFSLYTHPVNRRLLNTLVQAHPGISPLSPALLPDSASSFAASPLLTVPSLGIQPSFNNSAVSAHPPAASLNPMNYPNVKFWYRKTWSLHSKDRGNSTDVAIRGKTLMSKGINKNAKYIEDADGEPVNGWRLRDILAHARAIWASFHSVKRAPPTWGKANAEVAQVYRREMRTRFPKFSLCDNDWKADQLATEHYSSWYHNHVKAIESNEEETTDSAPVAGSKRCSIEPTAVPSKKPKKVAFIFPDMCIA